MKCIAANGNTLYVTNKSFTGGYTGPFWNDPATVCPNEVRSR